ncbi:MAG: helix-turn-helix transcriptional regulator [Methanomethylovorans sp.]|uniref:helix-turn-helix transcriptional regulator n=1 Tax=Methanomethylovorans sp. TaxID=2758717 RepID=UPI003530ABED
MPFKKTITKIRNLLIVAILCLLFIQTTSAAEVATVHGAIYEWETFKLLENTIVEVNSTPPQSQVAKYGLYSFDLPVGIYLLNASYYEDGELVYYAEENLNITDGGDYLLDMLLLPAYPKGSLNDSDLTEITTGLENKSLILDGNESKTTVYLIAAGAIVIVGTIAAFALTKRKASQKNEPETRLYDFEYTDQETLTDDGTSLPHDLQQVVDIIKNNGGRITQRDLRSKMSYSEAKVSLMVSDLENRGIVEKFKKGRGNIIVLKENDHQNL